MCPIFFWVDCDKKKIILLRLSITSASVTLFGYSWDMEKSLTHKAKRYTSQITALICLERCLSFLILRAILIYCQLKERKREVNVMDPTPTHWNKARCIKKVLGWQCRYLKVSFTTEAETVRRQNRNDCSMFN